MSVLWFSGNYLEIFFLFLMIGGVGVEVGFWVTRALRWWRFDWISHHWKAWATSLSDRTRGVSQQLSQMNNVNCRKLYRLLLKNSFSWNFPTISIKKARICLVRADQPHRHANDRQNQFSSIGRCLIGILKQNQNEKQRQDKKTKQLDVVGIQWKKV